MAPFMCNKISGAALEEVRQSGSQAVRQAISQAVSLAAGQPAHKEVSMLHLHATRKGLSENSSIMPSDPDTR